MRLQTKITAQGISFTMATAAVIIGIMLFRQAGMTREVGKLQGQINETSGTVADKMKERTGSELEKVDKLAWEIIAKADEEIKQRSENNFALGKEQVAALGSLHLDPQTEEWQYTDALTKETHTVALPKLVAGTTWLGHNKDAKVPSPAVDEVRHITGSDCTFYQRVNEGGDMIRVCTSTLDADGSRAIGSFVPHLNADGSETPILQQVLQGKVYRGNGMTLVGGKWYSGMWEPIWDEAHQKVIGMFGVAGTLQKNDAVIHDTLMKLTVGKTGNMFIIGTDGQQQGVYILSRGGKRDGENVWDTKDDSGRTFMHDMAEKAGTTKDGASVPFAYPWREPGDSKPRMKFAMVTYYEPRHWMIGASCYENELYEAQDVLADSFKNMLGTVQLAAAEGAKAVWWVGATALFLAVLSLVIGSRVAKGHLPSACRHREGA